LSEISATSTTELDAALEAKRAAVVEAEERAENARVLARAAEGLRRDIHRLAARQEHLAALGRKRVSFSHVVQHQALGPVEVEIESKLTGSELAAKVEPNVAHLRSELARVESEIAELLDAA
jgi:hypothetical protein